MVWRFREKWHDSQVGYLMTQLGEKEVKAIGMPSARVTRTIRGELEITQEPSRMNENRDRLIP